MSWLKSTGFEMFEKWFASNESNVVLSYGEPFSCVMQSSRFGKVDTMTVKRFFIVLCGIILLGSAGCSQPVLKQDIPVTTNPMGAKIYANGQLVGTTPTTVSLERNRDHILTLVKESYRQEDVVIAKQYQKEKVYLKAIQSGINSGLFFKDPRMGMNSGMGSVSRQEETGEAYILAPTAVKVSLMPLSGPVPSPITALEKSGPASQPAETANAPALSDKEVARELLKIGAGAALSQTKPLEKKTETSSSSKTYTQSDGTVVRETSSTSVGVSVNPAGLINALDVLFR